MINKINLLIFSGLNLLQYFLIAIFIAFMSGYFNEPLVNLYVVTDCNLETFNQTFLILIMALLLILGGAGLLVAFRKFNLKRMQ